MATRPRNVTVSPAPSRPAAKVSEAPAEEAPKAAAAPSAPPKPAAPVEPAKPAVDPSAPVAKASKVKTGKVRPKNPFPIYVGSQNVMLPVGHWTLVELNTWVEAQVKAGILELEE